ncbi:MAG: short-chain dehydrogenase, partial [Nitrosopumilaceae archaeon]
MYKAIVIGGSRGIGKAISSSFESLGYEVFATSKKELDTSNLSSVKNFIQKHPETDILVLNTGGPPTKEFFSVTQDDWLKYHNQLFLGFCMILQKIKI